MHLIGARASDWRPSNPDLHPLRWIAAFICAFLVYLLAMGTVGSFVNG